jgi:hypothetical protein
MNDLKTIFLDYWPTLLQPVLVFATFNIAWWISPRRLGSAQYLPTLATVNGYAAVMAALITGSGILNLAQTRAAIEAQTRAVAKANSSGRDPLVIKAEFLAVIDDVTGQPDRINDLMRREIFEKYKSLFPNGLADLVIYRDEIKKSYNCHYHLYLDLLKSLDSKIPLKSSETQLCEAYGGQFFNRAKLFTDETLRNHENLLKNSPPKADIERRLQELKIRFDSVDLLFR